jgi:hypothetical protein
VIRARSSFLGVLPLSPLATALVLFALTGHALLAASSHFHTGRGSLSAARQNDDGRVGQRQDAGQAGKTAGHTQCLLCRLQREVISGLRHGAPQIAAPHALSQHLARNSESNVSSATLLSPTGRAPPCLS